jgi:hypothetical protein
MMDPQKKTSSTFMVVQMMIVKELTDYASNLKRREDTDFTIYIMPF